MGLLGFFNKSSKPEKAPDDFDCLAAISKVGAIKVRSHAFYQKHRLLVEAILEFQALLRGKDSLVGRTLVSTLPTVEATAQSLRQRFAENEALEELRPTVDARIREFMPQLLPILEDTSHPEYLNECRWIIEAANKGMVAES